MCSLEHINKKLSRYRSDYSSATASYLEYDTLEECESAYYSRYGEEETNCMEYVYADIGDPMYWRIIRINEDESIRLIYQGTMANAMLNATTIGSSDFSVDYFGNAYVGYMYGTPNSSS